MNNAVIALLHCAGSLAVTVAVIASSYIAPSTIEQMAQLAVYSVYDEIKLS